MFGQPMLNKPSDPPRPALLAVKISQPSPCRSRCSTVSKYRLIRCRRSRSWIGACSMRDSRSVILDSPFARRLERTGTGRPCGNGLDTIVPHSENASPADRPQFSSLNAGGGVPPSSGTRRELAARGRTWRRARFQVPRFGSALDPVRRHRLQLPVHGVNEVGSVATATASGSCNENWSRPEFNANMPTSRSRPAEGGRSAALTASQSSGSARPARSRRAQPRSVGRMAR